MKKVVNVGTIGHIDFGKVFSIEKPSKAQKAEARKRKKLIRELGRRQKRLDELKDT